MGYSIYSSTSRTLRGVTEGYDSLDTRTISKVYKSKEINKEMSPKEIKIRESRDSEAHPNTVSIILGLDVTGSMMNVPVQMVKEGLPHIVTNIIQAGIPDPQILFLGIGDHEYDVSPLQIGQFESGDEELDHWLTNLYLEKGGGSNDGESYMLAWYTGAFLTSIDCFEKRDEKGFIFTIGDEPVLKRIKANDLNKIFGGQNKDWTSEELLEEVQKKYNVYHIHIKETGAGTYWRNKAQFNWKDLLGQNFIEVDSHEEVPQVISGIVSKKINTTIVKDSTENTEESSDIVIL